MNQNNFVVETGKENTFPKRKGRGRSRKNKKLFKALNKKSKPFSVRLSQDNFRFMEGKNFSEFVEQLITRERFKQIDDIENEERWRKIIYRN